MTFRIILPEKELTFSTREGVTILEALIEAKEHHPDLFFFWECRSGICGSCTVMANGQPVLACKTKLTEGMLLAPLANHDAHEGLTHDRTTAHAKLSLLKSSHLEGVMKEEDREKIALQATCILCDSCYAACPVLTTNPSFLGPFVLSQALRLANDVRQQQGPQILEAIQHDGIWACTLCGNCTLVCPEGIDPRADITLLRTKSLAAGYSDPTMMANFGFGGFGGDFGFGGGFS
ncbi:MAG: 4Fe-4S dicluster domain-containing protein [Campylobacterales bacterium]